MWSLLFASILLQTAPASGIACRSDPATGAVEVIITRTGTDGELLTPASGSGHDWEAARLEGRPEAAALDWYRADAPIVRNGERYLPVERTWSPGGAVNRYLRHAGLHKGAPLFTLWPGGDIDLAVLVRQEGCVFRSYEREGPR